MDPRTHQRAREHQANLEVGTTDVRPAVARALAFAFILVLVAAGVIQSLARVDPSDSPASPASRDSSSRSSPCRIFGSISESVLAYRRSDGGVVDGIIAGNRALLGRLAACEERLEDQSAVGRAIRPAIQTLLTRMVGVGNEQAYVGRDGWLFFRPDVDHVTGPGFLEPARLARRRLGGDEWTTPPQPDPRMAILDFQRQLATRGIALVVMPTPVKPTIHPERLARVDERGARPWQNVSFDTFVQELTDAGVLVFDPAPALFDAAISEPQYLETDTHWRPEAVMRVAAELAEFIESRVDLAETNSPVYERRPAQETAEIVGRGDIVSMLELDRDSGTYPPERVRVAEVRSRDATTWQPDASADVLLLGDSFTNMFSLEGMGFGRSAGLAEQLAFALQRGVDRSVRNDNGAFATRQALATDLARGTDRLSTTRVVVYQFATRELSFGDWRMIELPASVRGVPDDVFVAVPAGVVRVVSGVVSAASVVPRPGTVPYRDHIRAVHLTQVVQLDDQSGPLGTEAVVYVWSMRDNVWTEAATYAAGDPVMLRVRSWDDVADTYEGVNRSELESDRLILVEPLWGELANP